MSGLGLVGPLIVLGLVVLAVALATRSRRRLGLSAAGMLLGPITRAQLDAFPGFTPAAAKGYAPEADAVVSIASRIARVTVLVFIGTWCPDSVRQVPRFLALLDKVGLPKEQCSLVGLDRSKRDEAGLAAQHSVERVPTFVVMRDGQELGRITERPKYTLERDLARILAGHVTP